MHKHMNERTPINTHPAPHAPQALVQCSAVRGVAAVQAHWAGMAWHGRSSIRAMPCLAGSQPAAAVRGADAGQGKAAAPCMHACMDAWGWSGHGKKLHGGVHVRGVVSARCAWSKVGIAPRPWKEGCMQVSGSTPRHAAWRNAGPHLTRFIMLVLTRVLVLTQMQDEGSLAGGHA